MKQIPIESREIQKGLFVELRTFIHDGIVYSRYNLYSSEGYCFWDKTKIENYDKSGVLRPIAERSFSQFAIIPYMTDEEINEKFVSVPIQADFKIK